MYLEISQLHICDMYVSVRFCISLVHIVIISALVCFLFCSNQSKISASLCADQDNMTSLLQAPLCCRMTSVNNMNFFDFVVFFLQFAFVHLFFRQCRAFLYLFTFVIPL